jgi:putative glutamine amidotransferase
MKGLTRYLRILLLALLSVSFFHCQHPYEEIDKEKTRIIIVNPHAGYLNSFIYLIENEIINIHDLELTCVIYARANNDYDNLTKLLEQDDYSYIHIKKIDGDLDRDVLFQENSCSQYFYDIFKESDGILFLGGDDLSPSIYEQKTSLLTNTNNPYRHYFELSFLFHLLGGSQNNDFKPYLEENPDYVIYGFCLGVQIMNVATGGTLYQDIPSEIYGLEYIEDVLSLDRDLQHSSYLKRLLPVENLMLNHFHRIKLTEDQFFIKKLKLNPEDQPLVCSSHHQALKDLGKGFRIIATSVDGKVIEAVEHKKYKNVIGVQFHPEFSFLYNPAGEKYKPTPDDNELISIYELLIRQNDLLFHKKFWDYFSKLFSEENETKENVISTEK